MTKFSEFLRDDAGAVTIDWVALTAGIVLLGVAVVYGVFSGGVQPLTEEINNALSSTTIESPRTGELDFGGGAGTGSGTGN